MYTLEASFFPSHGVCMGLNFYKICRSLVIIHSKQRKCPSRLILDWTFASEASRCCVNKPENLQLSNPVSFALHLTGGFSIFSHTSCGREQTASGDSLVVLANMLIPWLVMRLSLHPCSYLLWRSGGGGCSVGPRRCESRPAALLHRTLAFMH